MEDTIEHVMHGMPHAPPGGKDVVELQRCFDTVCVNPELNIEPISGTFMVRKLIPRPSILATLSDQRDLALLRETTAAVEASVNAYLRLLDADPAVSNLDTCLVSASVAETLLQQIASHRCAYGRTGGLENPQEKARATFLSMQGGNLDPEAMWFATTDCDELRTIYPAYFDRENLYFGDWIAFAVICVQGDCRTISVLFGGDTD